MQRKEYDDDLEGFREDVIDRLAPRLYELLVCSYLGLPGSLKGKPLLEAINATVGDKEVSRKMRNRLEDSAKELVRGITSTTAKTRLMKGQTRLLSSISAALEQPTPEWLLEPKFLTPRRIVSAVRQRTPPHILTPEAEEYIYLIARLYTEVVNAMPKFERHAPKASAVKLHHFVPDIEYIIETAVTVERRPEEEADYCHTMIRQLDYVELFGADIAAESKRHSLSVAYVSLSISQLKGLTEEYLRPMSLEDLLETLQPDQNRILIRGHAGSGKSTLFRWIALQAMSSPPVLVAEPPEQLSPGMKRMFYGWRAKVPFLIRLRDCPDGRFPSSSEFVSMIAKSAGDPSPEWINTLLVEGRALLLLDGVDEIPQHRRDDVKDALEKITKDYPNNSYIISSRPEAIPRRWLETLGFRDAHVNPLSDPDKVEFIKKWHQAVELELQRQGRLDKDLTELCSELISRLPEHPAVNRLAYNPLLCAMICALHRDRGKRLPQSASDLCESLCQMLLERRELESGLNMSGFPLCYVELSYAQKRAIVQELAHFLVRNGLSAMEVEIATERVQAVLSRFGKPPTDAQEDAYLVLKVLVERSGMLREQRPNIIDFVHNTLKEFLAAERFVQDQDYGVLARNCFDSSWTPVLFFAVAYPNAKFSTRLIESVLESSEISDLALAHEEFIRTKRLLVLRLRAAATELEPRMHDLVNKLTDDLFPPPNLESSEVYAGIGNIAVSFLHYRASLAAGESAACVRTLRLIGTSESRQALMEYIADPRLEVISELLQAVGAFEIPSLREVLNRGDKLSSDIAIQVSSLRGISMVSDSIKCLDLRGTVVKDLIPLNDSSGLQIIRLGPGNYSLWDLRPPSLEHLSIEDSEVVQISGISHLANLRHLSIVRSAISGDFEHLPQAPHLEILELSRSHWGAGDKFLESFKNVHTLELSHSSFSDFSVLKGFRNLSHLNVAGTGGLSSVSVLSELKKLSHLDLQETDIEDEEITYLQSSLPNLRILRPKGRMLDIKSLNDKISVVIVTVREDEYQAVCAAFHASATITGGKNIYRYASVDTPDSRVGVAICRCSEQGNAKAQTVTNHAIEDFTPAPQWIFLVGIAGGFPDQDFTLGDVVVANRLHDFSVTAALSGGVAETYGRGGPMDSDTEKLLAWLPSLHEAVDWRADKASIRARPHEAIGEKPKIEDYYGQKKWMERVYRSLKAQLGKDNERVQPRLWIAPNISGNTLLKNAALAKKWKTFARQAASVEMEMAGAYEAVHAHRNVSRLLGIRGISDIVGYKRSAGWLEYACRTSASVAYALVSCGMLHRIVSPGV